MVRERAMTTDSLALASSNNDAAGASLHDNTYWSTAPDPPDTWSRGWFSLGGSVPMSEWLATTGETNATVEQVSFVDPDRTIATYAASIGLDASYEAFMAEAEKPSKYNWRPELTAASAHCSLSVGMRRKAAIVVPERGSTRRSTRD